MFRFTKKRIYLDYAAATPVHEDVWRAMQPYFRSEFANPGAVYTEGVRAVGVVEDARTELARLLGVRPEGVIFTGNGTESNNLALFGVIEKMVQAGKKYTDMEIISSRLEHPSISKVLESLQARGVTVRFAEVAEDGRVEPDTVRSLISKKTVLVTFAYVNSEIGVINPIRAIARVVKETEKKFGTRILLHTDAAQAPLWLSCNLNSLGVDLLSLDAGKCYGPKGVGVLVRVRDVELMPVMLGGGQEFGLRSGTENVPLIVGAVRAFVRAQHHHSSRALRVLGLRDVCIQQLLEIPDVVLNGSQEHRVANNINISVPGIEGEFVVVSLDLQGIACATRSACGSKKGGVSNVILEYTKDESRATSSVRITLGEETTSKELELFVQSFKKIIESQRKALSNLTRR